MIESIFTISVFLAITGGTVAGLAGLFWLAFRVEEKFGGKTR